MSVVIAGGHGRGALLTSRLPTERSRRVSGIIRQPEQAADVRAADTVPVVADPALATAGQLAQVPSGVQAAVGVQAALSSPVRGMVAPRSRRTHGRDHGAVLAVGDAAQLAGVRRFLLLSAMGSARARSDPADQLRADLPASQGQDRPRPAGPPALDCTVIRPGWFRDGPSTGLVHLIAPGWPGPGGGGFAPPRRTSRPPPPSEPVEAAPCPHTRPTVFGLHHRCSLRRRHHIRVPESDSPRTVKGSDRP
ncbi:NAD(P)H-binding protein [Streptomyces sp. NPDC057966]|uniref:NAD(P)H-binding protein n=1 Tax=Streptomyces sp. NPDC057966 TaxID=3346292 RepID=UPI0036E2AF94